MFIGTETKSEDAEMPQERIRQGTNTHSKRFPRKEKVLQLFLDKNNFQSPVRTRNIGGMLVADFEEDYIILYSKKGKHNQRTQEIEDAGEEYGTSCPSRLYCGEYHTKRRVYQFATELLKLQREKENRAYSSKRLDKNKRFWFLDN